MFHALMERFQLELFVIIAYFPIVVTFNSCFLSCRPFVVNATFSKDLVVSSVSWLGQLTVALMTKAYRKENKTCELYDGAKIGRLTKINNPNNLILK